MAPKNVEFHEEAAREFEAAVEWYISRNTLSAMRFAESVSDAVAMIAEFPQRWPKHSHGTRRFVLRRFPYLVIYRERSDAIQIVAIAHVSRRPGYWKARR